MNKLLFIFIFSISFLSCKKAEDRSCLKSTGEITSKTIYTGNFSKLYLMEHIEYVLVQDTVSFVYLQGGKNLLGLINCSVVDGELTIKNENKCKFLRYKHGKIIAEIHFVQLSDLVFQGTELLTNRNNWNFNYLNIILKDSGGSMNLTNFNGNYLNIVNTHGWGDVTMSGNAKYFRVDLDGNGYFDSRNFMVNDSISIISTSSTLSKVNSTNCLLKAELKGAGDIWYYGIPIKIEKKELGAGKLIDKN